MSDLLRSMSARLASTEAGNAFFQPLDLHVEPADPLVELGLERRVVTRVAATAVAEEGFGAVEELLLPLADLDGEDLVRLGEFGDGPGLLGGLQGDLGLECGRMSFACPSHDVMHLGMDQRPSISVTSRAVQEMGSTSTDAQLTKWYYGEGGVRLRYF